MSDQHTGHIRPKVTDAEIIELYRQGLSQKDIVRLYKASLLRTRKVLKTAGFNTSVFHQHDQTTREIILAIVASGATYPDIESICDISVDAVQQLVTQAGMQGLSRQSRAEQASTAIPRTIFPGKASFLTKYYTGSGFCELCKQQNLPAELCVYLFWELCTDNGIDLNPHRSGLANAIRLDAECGFSVTSIAKKHSISKSIVRQALNN